MKVFKILVIFMVGIVFCESINVFYLNHSWGREMGVELGEAFKDIFPSYMQESSPCIKKC